MNFKLAKAILGFRYNFRDLLDWIIFLLKMLTLSKSKEYGFTGRLTAYTQHCYPNPALVESYYGNITDIASAKCFGTDNLKEYSQWSWRSCGVTNVATILKTFNKYKGSLYSFINEIVDSDGYLFEDKNGNKDLGWKHIALIDALNKRGFDSYLLKKVIPEKVILDLLKGNFVIASIKSRLNPGTSHMILIKGFKFKQNKIALNVFDPYTLDGNGGEKEILFSDFKKIFLNKGISVLIKR